MCPKSSAAGDGCAPKDHALWHARTRSDVAKVQALYRRRRAAARRCCRLSARAGRAGGGGWYRSAIDRAASATSRILCECRRSTGAARISSISSLAARRNRSSADSGTGRAAARAASRSAAWRALARLRDAAARHAAEQYFARRPRGSNRGGIGAPQCAHVPASPSLTLLILTHVRNKFAGRLAKEKPQFIRPKKSQMKSARGVVPFEWSLAGCTRFRWLTRQHPISLRVHTVCGTS